MERKTTSRYISILEKIGPPPSRLALTPQTAFSSTKFTSKATQPKKKTLDVLLSLSSKSSKIKTEQQQQHVKDKRIDDNKTHVVSSGVPVLELQVINETEDQSNFPRVVSPKEQNKILGIPIDAIQLEKDKLNLVKEILQEIYIMNTTQITIIEYQQELPTELRLLANSKTYTFRTNFSSNRTTTAASLTNKDISIIDNKSNIVYKIISTVGRGAYGYTILATKSKLLLTPKKQSNSTTRTPTSMRSIKATNSIIKSISPTGELIQDEKSHKLKCDPLIVLKIGFDDCFVIWELLIHLIIQQRSSNRETYLRHFLPPEALFVYKASAILAMPYANLGTLVHVMNTFRLKTPKFSVSEHEYLVKEITKQMIDVMLFLHLANVIHTDIKTDNWVLRESNSIGLKRTFIVCLIDFGKAKDIHMNGTINSIFKKNLNNTSICFIGDVSAKGFGCREMLEGLPWTIEADCFGVCACIHSLLFLEDMSVILESIDRVSRRGFDISTGISLQTTKLLIPSATLKRYWDRANWSQVYLLLLNCSNRSSHLQSLQSIFEHLSPQPHVSQTSNVKYSCSCS